MPLISVLVPFFDDTPARASEVDNNFAAIRDAFNASAVLTDVATAVTVTHTFAAVQDFAAGAVFGPDPGGTETVRVSGGARVTGELVLPFGSQLVWDVNGAHYAPIVVNGSAQTQLNLLGNFLGLSGTATSTFAGPVLTYLDVFDYTTNTAYKLALLAAS